jgi:hypothetical protein
VPPEGNSMAAVVAVATKKISGKNAVHLKPQEEAEDLKKEAVEVMVQTKSPAHSNANNIKRLPKSN